MTKEAERAQSQDMNYEYPSHASSDVELVEKVDDNLVPQVLEHLRTAKECSVATLIQNTENQTLVDSNVLEAKKTKKRRRSKANKNKKRDLSVPVEESMEEVIEHLNATGECSVASSTKDPKGHAQVDNNSEAKQTKSMKRRKRGNKKRKLSSDSSLPSKGVIQGTSENGSPPKVSNSLPASACTEELMEEVVPVHKPSFLNKEKDTPLVGESAEIRKDKEIKTDISENSVEEHSILSDTLLKIVPEKCFVKLSEDKLPIITSELSETTVGNDVCRPNIEKDELQPAPLGVFPGELKRKLLVLDINGILTDIVIHAPGKYTPDLIISGKAVFKRPFCDDFLRFCFDKFHVGVWSSRAKKNVKLATDFLMGELQSKLLFCWDQSKCTDTGFYTLENREKPMLLKELKKLWEKHEPGLPWEIGVYNESNTLLLDDSPYKALRNPPYTAIFPKPYCYKDVNDNSLGPGGDLRVYLEGLSSVDDVPKYVEANPFGQRAITNANASWNFYRKVIHDNSSPIRNRNSYQSASKQPALQQRYN